MTIRTATKLKNSLLATTFSLLLATPIVSQAVELIDTVGDYQIVKVLSSSVCFAAYNGNSENDIKITYATYKTKAGDHWQVAGYVDQDAITSTGDLLSVSFDKEPLFARGIEFSNGKFAIPLTADGELTLFTELVESKQTLELSLKGHNDSIVIDLTELRKAREAIDSCLAGIE